LDASFPSATYSSGTISGTISDPIGSRSFSNWNLQLKVSIEKKHEKNKNRFYHHAYFSIILHYCSGSIMANWAELADQPGMDNKQE
jgi:hypothetical protein